SGIQLRLEGFGRRSRQCCGFGFFQRATAIDPNFATAFSGMCMAGTNLGESVLADKSTLCQVAEATKGGLGDSRRRVASPFHQNITLVTVIAVYNTSFRWLLTHCVDSRPTNSFPEKQTLPRSRYIW